VLIPDTRQWYIEVHPTFSNNIFVICLEELHQKSVNNEVNYSLRSHAVLVLMTPVAAQFRRAAVIEECFTSVSTWQLVDDKVAVYRIASDRLFVVSLPFLGEYLT
jgi:hypothetical protein